MVLHSGDISSYTYKGIAIQTGRLVKKHVEVWQVIASLLPTKDQSLAGNRANKLQSRCPHVRRSMSLCLLPAKNHLTLHVFSNITGMTFEPVPLHGDNTGSIFLAQNPVNHNRSKHIDVKFHHIRQQLERKKVTVQYIPSADNLADPFTKPLPRAKWMNFLSRMFGRK